MGMAVSDQAGLSGRIAFTYPDFVLYQVARLLIVASLEMQSVAVGWQVYEMTRRPLDLGLVGLAQFLPGILLFLASGHAADRFERRRLILVCQIAFAICSALLLAITLRGPRAVFPIYAVLVLLGVVRSFNGPAGEAFLPQLVAEEHFPNAVAWAATIFQTATIFGPIIGGVVYAATRGPSAVYGTAIVTSLMAAVATSRIHPRRPPKHREPPSLKTVLAGFHYILAEEVDPWFHLARLVCGAAGRSSGAAAGVREGDSENRSMGTRAAARSTWGGRSGNGDLAGVSSDSAACRVLRCCGALRDLGSSPSCLGFRGVYIFRSRRCCYWARATW